MVFTDDWFAWALLSAVFAAPTAIFAKLGMAGIDSDFATLVRTVVILVTLTGFVWVTGKASNPFALQGKTWLFLVLSGLATGRSWVCYFVLGVVVMSELFWLVPPTVLWCIAVYALVVRSEERQLDATYGVDYRAYQAAVARWLPRVTSTWAIGHPRARMLQALIVECHVILWVIPVVLKEVGLARLKE
jgi:transporter family protein